MQRPTSVTVFGVLNIVFGVLGLSCAPLSTLYVFFLPHVRAWYAANRMPFPDLSMLESPQYRTFLIVTLVVGLVASIAVLASGIGLLKLRPWARAVSVVYAVYSILAYPVGQVISYMLVVQPALEAVRSSPSPMGPGLVGGFAGGICGGFIHMAHPILLLVFMLLPTVRKAFHPPQPPDLPGEDGTPQSDEY